MFVVAGQLDGTPGAEIVTGPGSGGGPDLRVYGLGRVALFWRVILPGALPSILVGLRYALGIRGLTLIVAAIS